ncbi:hypothetical protein Avbf_13327, partial [Armadillidium vulgare]
AYTAAPGCKTAQNYLKIKKKLNWFTYFSHLLLKILCLLISIFEPILVNRKVAFTDQNIYDKNLNVDIWKPIELNKAKFENETKMISRVPALSITLCSLLSSRTLTANVFCFQDGICQIFSISLCHGLFAVENEEILTCYSNIDF